VLVRDDDDLRVHTDLSKLFRSQLNIHDEFVEYQFNPKLRHLPNCTESQQDNNTNESNRIERLKKEIEIADFECSPAELQSFCGKYVYLRQIIHISV
jgi:hypothetical protein